MIKKILSSLLPRPLVRTYRRLRAFTAKCVYGWPHRKLKIVGVTGTDGKTTTVNLVGHIVRGTGMRVGWISTLGAQIHTQAYEIPRHTTTVDPFTFYRLLRQMVRARVELAVVELTSHALEQGRVGIIPLTAAIVTNLSHEHLDYHRSVDEYLEAKAKIFKFVRRGKKFRGKGAVVLDCEEQTFSRFERLAILQGLKVVTFGMGRGDVRGERHEESLSAMSFTLITAAGHHIVRTRLLGDHNLRNILGAAALSHVLDVPWEKIHEGIETFQPLPGRLEFIYEGQPFSVIVDFAHTPNALYQVLTLLKRLTRGKIFVVFGATGERDPSKRPLMGEVVGSIAHGAFITEEDPRSESVDDISRGIEKGFLRIGKERNKDYWLISDRREAIRAAFARAHTDDTVLLAGKGHERTMARAKGVDVPWDDREAAREELRRMGWKSV